MERDFGLHGLSRRTDRPVWSPPMTRQVYWGLILTRIPFRSGFVGTLLKIGKTFQRWKLITRYLVHGRCPFIQRHCPGQFDPRFIWKKTPPKMSSLRCLNLSSHHCQCNRYYKRYLGMSASRLPTATQHRFHLSMWCFATSDRFLICLVPSPVNVRNMQYFCYNLINNACYSTATTYAPHMLQSLLKSR